MTIGDLETRTGIPRATIRYYEQEGFLAPKRMENGYRDLTDEELQAYYPDDKARAFCKRKYVSEFAWEMDRSTKEILKNWEGK